MSPVPLHVVETERVHGPLTSSETRTSPGTSNWLNHPTSRSPARTGSVRVRVYDGRRVAGEAAAPWTNSGDCAGVVTVRGAEAARGGGRHGRRGGIGAEDGAHRVPFDGVAKGGRPVLGARGARRDVLFIDGPARRLCARRVRDAIAASRRDRPGSGVGKQGREHELARTHRRGRTGVDDPSLITVRSGDLVERAGEGDARIVGDRPLQERARRGGHGNGDPAGRRAAVLAVVEGDVTRVVIEGLRSGRRPRPGAVHVVRYLDLPGDVVLGEPPDQQIAPGDRTGERDGGRRDPRTGCECRSLDECRGGGLGEGRAGKEGTQSGNHGTASTGVGGRQKLHGNSLLYKGMSDSSLSLARLRPGAIWGFQRAVHAGPPT